MLRLRCFSLGVSLLVVCAAAVAQLRLSLDDALKLSVQRNGSIQSAYLSAQASASRARQARAGLLPSVTGDFEYENIQRQLQTGAARGFLETELRSPSVGARWRLFDSGTRNANISINRELALAESFSAKQTLRSVLFDVFRSYVETQRAKELQKISDAQVNRAENVVREAKARIEAGDLPRKDIYQPEADLLNAKVSKLQADNEFTTALQSLLARIGWQEVQTEPELQSVEYELAHIGEGDISKLVSEAIKNRPDLLALRRRIVAQNSTVQQSARDSIGRFSVDVAFSRLFYQDVTDTGSLQFLFSMPLFDGGLSKEIVREEKLSLASQNATLAQAERDARAEIEASVRVLQQNHLRQGAADKALEAARVNYDAAREAFRKGAAGTSIITVVTAQLTLVTAESNHVEAKYDLLIADARYRLVAGLRLLGETL